MVLQNGNEKFHSVCYAPTIVQNYLMPWNDALSWKRLLRSSTYCNGEIISFSWNIKVLLHLSSNNSKGQCFVVIDFFTSLMYYHL